MLCASIFALQGPILWIISRAAAIIAVSALSSEEGISIDPLVFPVLVSVLTSILPILPDFCSSLNSRSAPSSPSVYPKIAPMTSGLSTTPSISIVACTMYFAATGLILPMISILPRRGSEQACLHSYLNQAVLKFQDRA